MAISNTQTLNDFRLAFNNLESDFTNLSLSDLGDASDFTINGILTLDDGTYSGDPIQIRQTTNGRLEATLVGDSAGIFQLVEPGGESFVFSVDASGTQDITTSGQLTIQSGTDDNIVLDPQGTGITSVVGDLSVSGDVTGANLNTTSDERVKENIITIDNALEKAMQLRGVYYNKIGQEKKEVGVIAQEIEKILPEVVNNTSDIKTVSYGNIVGLLIEAIKELKKEVDALK